MLNWIAWNRTICINMYLALNNLQKLICHKTQPANKPSFSNISDFLFYLAYLFVPMFVFSHFSEWASYIFLHWLSFLYSENIIVLFLSDSLILLHIWQKAWWNQNTSRCYIVIRWFMQKYTYICWIHTDAIIIKTHDDKDTGTNDARRKEDAGRLLYKIFYLTSLFVSFERVVPSLRVRGSWGPNITEIFWPWSYGRQRCVFLVLHGCSTGALESAGCWLSLPHLVYLLNSTRLSPLARWTQLTGTQLSSVQFVGLILPSNSHAVIWTRLHNVFQYLGTGMCHFRFLWNGLCDRHRAEITVIQFRGHSLPVRQSMRV